jgi:AraC-like DNA-binding protein
MTYESRENLETGIDQYLMHCYDKRTVARATELATFLGISYRRLTRLCSRLLGEAPKASMRARQLSYAVRLLREGLIPVDEIGLMAGFGDRRTFYRAIRRTFGCSPLMVRNAVPNCP